MCFTIFSNSATCLQTRSLNKSGGSLRTQKLAAVALTLAALPTLRWYVLRLQDGGGELAGLVPLAGAAWFAIRNRRSLSQTGGGVWGGTVILVSLAITSPFLPAMIRALLMLAAAASVFGIWRKPGIACLLILSLPWTASMDFFLGYPLRLLTAINTEFLLRMTGTDVTRAGVQLLYEGSIVGVDPACSGMNMLWSTGLLTALLAAVFSLRWRYLLSLGLTALALALAGNSLRAALLFFPEVGVFEMPHLLHSGTGIAISGVCFFLLMKLAQGFFEQERKLLGKRQHGFSSPKPAAVLLFSIAALLVVASSIFSVQESTRIIPGQPILTSYQGIPLTRMPLTEAEQKFYGNFPGSIAVYESTEFKLIVRQVTCATRKLHPASHCLRAEGFRIGEKTVGIDENRDQWLSYSVTRNGDTAQVKEHVTCPSTHQNWPEISAWYWHAFFHPGEGPWQAVTLISK